MVIQNIKKYIRNNAEKILLPLEKIGVSERLLDIYVQIRHHKKNVNKVDRRVAEYDMRQKKGTVLLPFVHPFGGGESWLFMGLALRVRKYKPIFLVCDNGMPLCFRKIDHPRSRGTCINCNHRSRTLLDELGFEYEVMSKKGTKNIKKGKGVEKDKYVKASTRRFLKRYDIDDKSQEYEQFWKAAVNLENKTKRIIEEKDIDAVIGSHPAYVYSGVALEVAKDKGIPAMSFGASAYRKGTLLFGNMRNRSVFERFSSKQAVDKKLNRKLKEKETKEVDKVMKGRADGEVVRDRHYYAEGANKSMEIDTTKTQIALFPNLLWDGSIADSNQCFSSPIQWIKSTCNFVKGKEEFHLTVKPHPAELSRGSKVSVKEIVDNNFGDVKNITVLDPNTDIDPYKMVSLIDCGLVYTGTLGMEMAYRGTPAVVAGLAHYKGFGFTFDAETPADYRDFLERASELEMTERMVNRAKRYAHHLLIDRHLDIDGMEYVGDLMKLNQSQICESQKIDEMVQKLVAGDRELSFA